MINHIAAVPGGLVAHWSVSDISIVRTLAHQNAGYTQAHITTWNATGNIVDDRLFDSGDRIFIDLPAGQWLYEASPDNANWHNVLGNQQVNGLPTMLTGGPDSHVQIFVDNEMGAPEIWSRCTLQGAPAPTPIPVVDPAVVTLSSNVAGLQKDMTAVKKKLGLK